jgi:hypothetical protein
MRQHYDKLPSPSEPVDILRYFAAPADDSLSNDNLSKVFAGIPAMTALVLVLVGAITRNWNWSFLVPTILSAALISVMAGFFLSLVCANGHVLFFRNATIIMTLVLSLILSLIGGVSFGMMLAVVLLFALFSIGEWLCLD